MALHPGAVFVFIGLDPNTGFLNGTINLDDWGFIKTSGTLETNVKGVFAAGDVRAGSTRQVVSAAGEGATEALMVRQYLEATEGSRGYKGDSWWEPL
ncbi:MAG: FAD-dependent oxidoreductase [Chloroflexi bacterium]|nr:FAD-dependent oxidoreductase [Chloroflexota bacterium]